MIDVTFNASVCGTIKMANIAKNTNDIFCLSEFLSHGGIMRSDFRNERNLTIQKFYPVLSKKYDWVRGEKKTLQSILQRAKQGEDIRIWIGTNADDVCGFYWLMSKIKPFRKKLGNVLLLKLPRILNRSNNVIPTASWSQLEPKEIPNYLYLSEKISTKMIEYYSHEWLLLEQENSPLRALISDCLISVPEDFYDHLILRELDSMPNTFHEAELLSKVLAKHMICVSSMFISSRITNLSKSGKLIVTQDLRDEYHLFHRFFSKT